MENDDGYIKYQSKWKKERFQLDENLFEELNQARTKVFDNSWIGIYTDGIGYGNISMRISENKFIISGTATGGKRVLVADEYSLVTDYDILKNRISCTGLVEASSEALSHAAIYELHPNIDKIIHIHDLEIWKKGINKLPTTNEEIPYGTPEMAIDLQMVSKLEEGSTIVMGGHYEGVISYGNSYDEVIFNLKKQS